MEVVVETPALPVSCHRLERTVMSMLPICNTERPDNN